MFLITRCSPQATKAVNKHVLSDGTKWAGSYPFAELEVGYSFTVKRSAVNHNSLRSVTATAGTILRRVFKIVQHEELDLIEIVRLQ
jgi:hypothetical protein